MSKGSFSNPHWIHTNNFWEALAFMIVKGADDRMPPLVSSTTGTQGNGEFLALTRCNHAVDTASSSGGSRRFSPVVRRCHHQLPPPRISESQITSALCPIHEDKFGFRVNPSNVAFSIQWDNIRFGTIPMILIVLYIGSGSSSRFPSQVPSSLGVQVTSPSPIVYAHVQTLRGIIESRYHYKAPSRTTETRAQSLGDGAARYLLAHGYTGHDIDLIIKARRDCSLGSDFTIQLASLGMVMAEASYLWDLIDA